MVRTAKCTFKLSKKYVMKNICQSVALKVDIEKGLNANNNHFWKFMVILVCEILKTLIT